jgi:hypothetical protein
MERVATKAIVQDIAPVPGKELVELHSIHKPLFLFFVSCPRLGSNEFRGFLAGQGKADY